MTNHSFYKKEYISKEDNRIDVDNSNYNSAAVYPVCGPFGSGYWLLSFSL